MNYTIDSQAAGQRLDQWLSAQLADYSRTHIAEAIKAGGIRVNEAAAKANYRLKTGDTITVLSLERAMAIARAANIIDHRPALKVLAANDDFLIIDKPAGMIVHYPTDRPGEQPQRSPSVVDWLLELHPQAAKVGDDPSRPGIVHRLDKAVSGLMVVALNQDSFDDLKRQFKERLTRKQYLAIVHGQVAKDEDVINFPLERSADGRKQAAKPLGSSGKTAITEFQVSARKVNYTKLSINIKTGRTHQIRAHLAAYGNPVAGDSIYGTSTTKAKDCKNGTDRVMLASVLLGFVDRQGQPQQFTLPEPEALVKFWQQIK